MAATGFQGFREAGGQQLEGLGNLSIQDLWYWKRKKQQRKRKNEAPHGLRAAGPSGVLISAFAYAGSGHG